MHGLCNRLQTNPYTRLLGLSHGKAQSFSPKWQISNTTRAQQIVQYHPYCARTVYNVDKMLESILHDFVANFDAVFFWTTQSASADLEFLGGDCGNPSERSIEGVWAYGRMKFERLWVSGALHLVKVGNRDLALCHCTCADFSTIRCWNLDWTGTLSCSPYTYMYLRIGHTVRFWG